jgi:hypothetical protein
LTLLGLAALLLLIGFGGPFSSKMADKYYRKTIDENGIWVKAIVTGKKYLKGHYVVFEYHYKGRRFTNKEQNKDYHENLMLGEIIEIKMDTTNPEDSYIFATGIK